MSSPNSDDLFDTKNSSPNTSGSSMSGRGAVVQNGHHLQYAQADSYRMLTILTTDITTFQDLGDFTSLNTWISIGVSSLFPSGMSATFKVMQNTAISMVASGGYNYAFWLNEAGERWALRCRPDMTERLTIAKIVFPPGDYGLPIGFSYVGPNSLCAFSMPILEGYETPSIGMLVMFNGGWFTGLPLTGYAVQYVLDPNAFEPNGTWAASRPRNLPVIQLGNLPTSYLTQNYHGMSASVVDRGAFKATGGSDGWLKPDCYLVFVIDDSRWNTYSYVVNLGELFTLGFELEPPTWPPKMPYQTGYQLLATLIGGLEGAHSKGATLVQAPDGAVYAYYTDGTYAHSRRLCLNPSKPGTLSINAPQWMGDNNDPDGKTHGIFASVTPSAVFVPMKPTTGDSPCEVLVPVSDPSSSGNSNRPKKVYPDCTLQKYIQCILATSGSKPQWKLSTFYWGTIFEIPNYIVASLDPSRGESRYALSMIADTFPYPVPDTDVWETDSPSGMVNWGVCTYEYLAGREDGAEVATEVRTASGLKSEDAVYVGGIGFRHESSMTNGFLRMNSQSTTIGRASSISVETRARPNAEGLEHGPLTISPQGAFFAYSAPEHMRVGYYLLRLRGSATIANSLGITVGPDTSPYTAQGRSPVAGDFKTYCYTPGNLLTYEPGAINAEMQRRFLALGPAEQAEFVIGREDFGGYYKSGNYLGKIIDRFGVKSFGPEGNLPYLEFIFSLHGVKRNEFQSTSEFRYSNGSFIDYAKYSGVGWNIEISANLFDVVSAPLLQVEGYELWGAEYSASLTTTSWSAGSWGVQLGEYLNPLSPGEAYTVRMYILKPSPLWGTEMHYFGLDAGATAPAALGYQSSSPIRILFTVPYISQKLRLRLGNEFSPK